MYVKSHKNTILTSQLASICSDTLISILEKRVASYNMYYG